MPENSTGSLASLTIQRHPGLSARILTTAFLVATSFVAFSASAGAQNTGPTLPAGTVLYLHLHDAITSKNATQGQAISADLAREVDVNGNIALPFGSTIKGTVEKCSNPTAADQRASLLLTFNQLVVPGEGTFALHGHLSAVSNGRESLTDDGTITGVLQTEAPVSMLGGVIQRLGGMNSAVNDAIEKNKVGQVNTAIELPAGADIQVTLNDPLVLTKFLPSSGPARLPSNLKAQVNNILADAPKRSASKDNRPGDPINLMFIGTQQQIEAAFQKAGWLEPKARNDQSILRTVQAMANNEGYGAAPISDLYLFGRKQDMAFEKTLNTFNKRHHLRIWQTAATAPDGRPIWLGAGTHDVGLDIHPGVVSHATDPNLDDEREQVAADIFLGGNVQSSELVSPPNPLLSGTTATGGAWHTDGKVVVIDLKSSIVTAQQ